jgi:hypothetical protein
MRLRVGETRTFDGDRRSHDTGPTHRRDNLCRRDPRPRAALVRFARLPRRSAPARASALRGIDDQRKIFVGRSIRKAWVRCLAHLTPSVAQASLELPFVAVRAVELTSTWFSRATGLRTSREG